MAAGLIGESEGYASLGVGEDGYDDMPDGLEDPDAIPDPIYLSRLALLQQRIYVPQDGEDSSPDEDPDDYDLTAPPLES